MDGRRRKGKGKGRTIMDSVYRSKANQRELQRGRTDKMGGKLLKR